jgi:ATP-dependent Clp endopeptidase proteolytic subunit ClpP
MSASSKNDKKDDSALLDSFSLGSIGAYMLFSGIDEEASKDFCEFIIKANYVFPKDQTLTVLINCPGGDVYSGFGMVDTMDCSRLKIQTVAIGLVASMGAVVFTAGSKGTRIMSRNSFIMTHQFASAMEGKYHELIASRDHEDDLHSRFIKHFIRNSKMSEKQVKDIFLGSSDKYISSKEALKYGLCDLIRDPWSS